MSPTMSTGPELHALDERVSNLEGENRRLRRMLFAVIAIAALPFLAGYATPNDKIEASEFAIRDKGGMVRARLFIDDAGKTQLVLRDRDGKSPAILSAGEGATLSLSDKSAKSAVIVSASNPKGVIVVEEDGKPRAVLSPPKPIAVDAQDPWASPD